MRCEAVRKVRIHRQSFANAELLHNDEAQAINKAVSFVGVALEVIKSSSFFIRAGRMNSRQLLKIELIAEPDGGCMAEPAR